MHKTCPYVGPLLLAAAMLLPVANTGCTARVRVYDHSDYHNWDDREDRAYRRYPVIRRTTRILFSLHRLLCGDL